MAMILQPSTPVLELDALKLLLRLVAEMNSWLNDVGGR